MEEIGEEGGTYTGEGGEIGWGWRDGRREGGREGGESRLIRKVPFKTQKIAKGSRLIFVVQIS